MHVGEAAIQQPPKCLATRKQMDKKWLGQRVSSGHKTPEEAPEFPSPCCGCPSTPQSHLGLVPERKNTSPWPQILPEPHTVRANRLTRTRSYRDLPCSGTCQLCPLHQRDVPWSEGERKIDTKENRPRKQAERHTLGISELTLVY